MKTYIQRVSGLTLTARSESNHWVITDAPENLSGSNAASRPMEMVLMALGTCTGMDVLSILEKMRINLDDFKMEIDAERAKEHPKVYTKIHIKYIFYGQNLPTQSLERAIDLSQNTYCSVTAMLSKTAEITHEYEIRMNGKL